jgi:hypothetical protein
MKIIAIFHLPDKRIPGAKKKERAKQIIKTGLLLTYSYHRCYPLFDYVFTPSMFKSS